MAAGIANLAAGALDAVNEIELGELALEEQGIVLVHEGRDETAIVYDEEARRACDRVVDDGAGG
jgi:hypothetical protein